MNRKETEKSHAIENTHPAAATQPNGALRRLLGDFLVRPLALVQRRHRRHAELRGLSNHALKDIGLSRNDVACIARHGIDPRPRPANDCLYCDAA